MSKIAAAVRSTRTSDELLYLAGTAAAATLGVCAVFMAATVYLLV